MAQFMYYPENVLFNNIPPTIDKEFLRHHFRSAYYAQETAFNKNPGGGGTLQVKNWDAVCRRKYLKIVHD